MNSLDDIHGVKSELARVYRAQVVEEIDGKSARDLVYTLKTIGDFVVQHDLEAEMDQLRNLVEHYRHELTKSPEITARVVGNESER